MASENPKPLLTYEDLLALPCERRELDYGVLYEPPAPRYDHQNVAGRLFRKLADFLDAHPALGTAVIAPFDVILKEGNPNLAVQPDILVVARERLGETRLVGPPDVAIEVVSDKSSRRDTIYKRELYARHGVPEFWLVWPTDERIDVFVLEPGRPYGEPRTYEAGDTFQSDVLPGFSPDLAWLFAR
jgi:Uma2 family endonuclease